MMQYALLHQDNVVQAGGHVCCQIGDKTRLQTGKLSQAHVSNNMARDLHTMEQRHLIRTYITFIVLGANRMSLSRKVSVMPDISYIVYTAHSMHVKSHG